MANTLAEAISLERIGDLYVSLQAPQQMGNSAAIAYGGYALAFGIHAAYQAAPDGFHLYSALGHYLHAANTEERLVCTPVQIRRTRSFVTFRINVQQKVPSTGVLRSCVELQVDFHKVEPSVLSHSAYPTRKYTHWKHCLPTDELCKEWVESATISIEELNRFDKIFGLSKNFCEGRLCPEGVTTQNAMGISKNALVDQDHLHPTQKSSADWVRVKHPLKTEGEHMSSLAFIMDGILSFLPLCHNHLFFDDVGACSSLDFALRIFTHMPQVNKWHLREAINHHAGSGRSFSESKLWDEEGNLAACMTQQSILRTPDVAAKI
jgi:acyl-CoA thioesterase II